MTIDEFISSCEIRPADAIVMQKKLFGMVDHFVVYLGIDNGHHIFVANYTQGVRIIENQQILKFLDYLVPTNIDRFYGSDNDRLLALERAWSRVGEKAYDYLSNNCEHFKNWVHKGVSKSKQADNFTQGVSTILGVVAVVGLLEAIFKAK